MAGRAYPPPYPRFAATRKESRVQVGTERRRRPASATRTRYRHPKPERHSAPHPPAPGPRSQRLGVSAAQTQLRPGRRDSEGGRVPGLAIRRTDSQGPGVARLKAGPGPGRHPKEMSAPRAPAGATGSRASTRTARADPLMRGLARLADRGPEPGDRQAARLGAAARRPLREARRRARGGEPRALACL